MRPLAPDEAEWIKTRIGPLMPVVARMKQRLEKRGYSPSHKLYRAMSDAYDALRGLWITAHYEGCERGIGRAGETNRPTDPPAEESP